MIWRGENAILKKKIKETLLITNPRILVVDPKMRKHHIHWFDTSEQRKIWLDMIIWQSKVSGTRDSWFIICVFIYVHMYVVLQISYVYLDIIFSLFCVLLSILFMLRVSKCEDLMNYRTYFCPWCFLIIYFTTCWRENKETEK